MYNLDREGENDRGRGERERERESIARVLYYLMLFNIQGVIGYYDQPSEKCYLTGGINPDLANPNEIDQYLSSQNETPVSLHY